jgi:hypothetical protein
VIHIKQLIHHSGEHTTTKTQILYHFQQVFFLLKIDAEAKQVYTYFGPDQPSLGSDGTDELLNITCQIILHNAQILHDKT